LYLKVNVYGVNVYGHFPWFSMLLLQFKFGAASFGRFPIEAAPWGSLV
jgi:hypothetical protein